ncbi:MAG: hypothetical protein LLF94_06175 [Chlamydiales bacterium]|nr:hypothetical protein [Chlamydiales bacterium]
MSSVTPCGVKSFETDIYNLPEMTKKTPPFSQAVQHLNPDEQEAIMTRITRALEQVSLDEKASVITCSEGLIHSNMLDLAPLLIEWVAKVPQQERQNIQRQVHTFLANRELQSFDVTDTIIELLAIDPEQRDEVVTLTIPLVQDFQGNIWRCAVLKTVGQLPAKARFDVIEQAKPLFVHFTEPSQWCQLMYHISRISNDSRDQVISAASQKLPCSFGTFINSIKLAIAKKEAVEKRQTKVEAPIKSVKAIKPTNQDPLRFFQAYVARTKVRKILEVANTTKDLPLSRDEFEFLASRSIGFRYSEKASQEFIQGIPRGDAVSLSGFPKAQVTFELGLYYGYDWENHIVKTNEPNDAPKALEARIIQFIKAFITNGLPTCGDEKTSEYLELLQLTHQVHFVLGNFKDADMPYDLNSYYGIGKCGPQALISGKISKYITLKEEFFNSLNLTPAELDTSIRQVFDKIKEKAITYIATELRLHIRKMTLMSNALEENSF